MAHYTNSNPSALPPESQQYLTVMNELLQYIFCNLTPEDNFSGSSYTEYQRALSNLKTVVRKVSELEKRVTELEGGKQNDQ